MGATNSILQNSLESATYVPPDLYIFNDTTLNSHHKQTHRKKSSSNLDTKHESHESDEYNQHIDNDEKSSSSNRIKKLRRKNFLIHSSSNDLDEEYFDEIISSESLLSDNPPAATAATSASTPPSTPPTPHINKKLKQLLLKTLQNLFYFHNNITELQLNMLIKVLKYHQYHSGEIVFNEGDIGNSLYIIDNGEVEVLIQNKVIRILTSGHIFGEIGLLFNSPRSATIRCLTSCSIYILDRKLLKIIQKITNSASILQRNRWLLSCSELNTLTPIHISRLFSTLRHVRYKKNEILFEKNKEIDEIILIERGRAKIIKYPTELLSLQTSQELELALGIIRPKTRTVLDEQTPHEFISKYYHRAASTVISDDNNNTSNNNEDTTKQLSKYITREESLPPAPSSPSSSSTQEIDFLYEGCIIGLPILHASANKSDEKYWKYVTSSFILPSHAPKYRRSSTLSSQHSFNLTAAESPRQDTNEENDQSTHSNTPPHSSSTTHGGGYIISPITVVALTDLQCSVFTIAAFERAFGPIPSTSSSSNRPSIHSTTHRPSMTSTLPTIPSQTILETNYSSKDTSDCMSPTSITNTSMKGKNIFPINSLRNMNPNNFYYHKILGKGGFGTVLLGQYHDHDSATSGISATTSTTSSGKEQQQQYAVKIMSKEEIAEKGQIRHVLDEAKILSIFNSPFILHLYSTFQTKNYIGLITDVCELGDLWSVIYETELFQELNTLPLQLIQFYMCGIVGGLHHMHSNNIIFRDLKPENILINRKGYIKIIDCGLAKRLPYEEDITTCMKDSNDNSNENGINIIYKAYSLCGTPEYLAPEFLFNQGVDRAVDIWALGILFYEMFMFRTPFMNEETFNNVELLFVAIASVQETITIPDEDLLDSKAQSPLASTLIHDLLRSEPTSRLGYEETIAILQHPFFHDYDTASALQQTAEPPFIPEIIDEHPSQKIINSSLSSEEMMKLLKCKPYSGQQSLWKEFGPMYEY